MNNKIIILIHFFKISLLVAGGYYNGRATMSIPLTSLVQPNQADDRTLNNQQGKKPIMYYFICILA